MPMYAYRAVNPDGKVVIGELDAQNPVDLELRLRRLNLDLIRSDLQRRQWRLFARRSISRKDLIGFCFHMEQMSSAGVPILDALNDLREGADNPAMREITVGLIESIQGGKRLSQAMADAPPGAFSEIIVSMVQSGEATGRLGDIFRNLTESLKWQDELAETTKRMLMYPGFIAAVLLATVLFLLLYLVPQLATFLQTLGHGLPTPTRFMLALSAFCVQYWPILLVVPIAAYIGLRLMLKRSDAFQYFWDDLILRIPYIGPILRKIVIARFADMFAMMYESGITVLDSIRICESTAGNAHYREALAKVHSMIEEGQSVTLAFQNVGIFPPLVIRLLRVGEATGKLDEALRSVNYFYNRDVKESVARLQVLIEPALILAMGVILGGMMLATLMPIYDLFSKIRP